MTAVRRYQLESWGATALVCLGIVLLASERVVRKAKGLLR